MLDINKVYITKEVADTLNISSSHILRLLKELLSDGTLSNNDVRLAGKNTYLFNELAIEKLRLKLKR